MVLKFKRIGQTLPANLSPADWLGESGFLFLEARDLGRVMTGRLFGVWGERLWLEIVDDPIAKDDDRQQLEPGLYVDLRDRMPNENNLPDLKSGYCEINSILRAIRRKVNRDSQREDLWKLRASHLRLLRDRAICFVTGVYEIADLEGTSEIQFHRIPRKVRNHDFAAGGIDPGERVQLVEQINEWNEHFRRTRAIDITKTKKAVKAFYMSIGLDAPQVVFVANPMAAAIAGAFATIALRHQKEGDTVQQHKNKLTHALLSSLVADALITTTAHATRNSIDELTESSISAMEVAMSKAGRALQETTLSLNRLSLADWMTGKTALEATVELEQSSAGDALETRRDSITTNWNLDVASIYEAFRAVVPNSHVRIRVALEQENITLRQLSEDLSGGSEILEQMMMDYVPGLLPGALLESDNSHIASFCKNHLGIELPVHDQYSCWEKLAVEGCAFVVHKEFCFVCDFPEIYQLDDQNRIHCEDGPALKWRNGSSNYYWHGVRVPSWIITSPEEITVESIQNEVNQEIRRIMFARYGAPRYLTDSGATEVHRDGFGILYKTRLEEEEDEVLMMVKVINSTMEPDGTYKEYFLRVPPTTRTAKAGIAWTFGVTEEEYEPDIES